jgi:hypothetical protein
MKLWSTGLIAAGLSLAVAQGNASTVYPVEVRETLMLSEPPPCTLCHRSDVGGDGTVVTPFGRSMLELGATGDSNRATLREALLQSDSEGVDSDFDGVTDLDELRSGDDPNDNPDPGAFEDLPLPEHGCAVSVTSSRAGAASFLLFSSLFAFAVGRRRARMTPRIG